MDVLQHLSAGFAVALLPQNLLFCLIGVVAGTLVGVLPGIGPSATIAIVLPITFGVNATSALIMLAGIYYGAKYGGAITSILIATPGESSSVMTAVDGHQMAAKGKAGPALALAATSSFIGGTASIVGLMLFAPPLATVAIDFAPPEYCALIIMGLSAVALLGGKSLSKSLTAAAFGLLLGVVGTDPMQGTKRFTFGTVEMRDGIDFVLVAMGLFAIAEILVNAESIESVQHLKVSFRGLLPNAKDILACRWTFLRSTVLGFFIGVLPGAGATIASFLAYGTEKKLSSSPERFGSGAPEGVAAPETADNAAAGGAMVPLLTLGIPGSSSTAVLLMAMVMYGVRPGPLLFQEHPDVVWALIASMYVGNVMLLVLNLPLVPLFASVTRLPYQLFYPVIMAFILVGAFALNGRLFDVWMVVVFGSLGYAMKKLQYPAAPLVLALVLGPELERSVTQSLAMSHGSLAIFVSRPVSAVLFGAIAVTLLFSPLRSGFRRSRGKRASDEYATES